jgi:uncharacterized protein (TIGR00730 family)
MAKKLVKNIDNGIVHPQKAYDNKLFIHSREGRILRILSEYLYPEQHFRKYGINKLIIFFGSARSISKAEYHQRLHQLENKLGSAAPGMVEKLELELKQHKSRYLITKAYEDAVELSRLMTEWSLKLPAKKRFHICSGGGPGMMEAANKGANIAGGLSIGFNISLPFEQSPNQFISPEHNFEFHYFFMRKFWFVYLGQALIVFPGGLGTLDEMMEILTLIQTKKITRKVPVLLYSEEFWKKVINLDYLAEMGMISEKDHSLFTYVNEPGEAFELLRDKLTLIHGL